MNIKLPIQYREGRMMGVLHHEIGTHFLRKYNDKLMPWAKDRKKYDLKPSIATEEGFASINQMFDQAVNPRQKPFLYRGALTYYSGYLASTGSFADVYKAILKYINDPDRAWQYTLRVK